MMATPSLHKAGMPKTTNFTWPQWATLGAVKTWFQQEARQSTASTEQETSSSSDTYRLFIQAEAHKACRRWTDAQTLYRHVLKLQPHHEEAWMGYLSTWEHLIGAAAAAVWLNEALSQCPLSQRLLWKGSELAQSLGDWYLVKRCLHRLTRLKPNHVEAWFQLGLAEEMLENWEEAKAAYDQVLVFDPACVSAHHNLANIAMRLEVYEEAAMGFSALLEAKPNFSKACLGLAICLEQLEQPREAITYYQQFIELKADGWQSSFAHQRLLKLKNISALGQANPQKGALLAFPKRVRQ